MPLSVDFNGGYRLECKLRKSFDIIANAKSEFLNFYFVGAGCGPATTPFVCSPVPNLQARECHKGRGSKIQRNFLHPLNSQLG